MKRPRGTGHVFRPVYRDRQGQRREASTWAIGYYDRLAGKPTKEYGFTTEAAAERALRSRLVDIERGRRVGPSVDRIRFEDLAKLIQADYAVNERDSAPRLDQSLAHLRRTFGGDRVGAITGPAVTAYAQTRRVEGAAAATVNRELAALKRAFRLAAAGRLISQDTVPHVGMLKEDNVRTGFFEPEAFEAVLRHLKHPAHRRAVTVAYVTGWRVPSEVLTREWRHLDLAAGWLRLEPGETKNGKGRMFPLDADPRLRAALQEARDEADAREKKTGRIVPWVFARKSGARILSFRKRWLEACRAAGQPGRLLHDFRRTAARNLIRRGVAERVAMELTGHLTRSVFDRYAIVDETMLLEAAEKMRGADSAQSRRERPQEASHNAEKGTRKS